MVFFAGFLLSLKIFVVAFLGISGQTLGSWGVYTGPGGLWDEFPPSSTPNGGRAYERCPKKDFHSKYIRRSDTLTRKIDRKMIEKQIKTP